MLSVKLWAISLTLSLSCSMSGAQRIFCSISIFYFPPAKLHVRCVIGHVCIGATALCSLIHVGCMHFCEHSQYFPNFCFCVIACLMNEFYPKGLFKCVFLEDNNIFILMSCFYIIIITSTTTTTPLDRISSCNPGWPWICFSPASASQPWESTSIFVSCVNCCSDVNFWDTGQVAD